MRELVTTLTIPSDGDTNMNTRILMTCGTSGCGACRKIVNLCQLQAKI